jgi:hypothetical protein
MAQYFVKRNDKVNGPFTSDQVNSGVKSKKLKATDLLATSKDGPWKPLSDFYQKKKVQTQATAKPKETAGIQQATAADPLLPPLPDSSDPFMMDLEEAVCSIKPVSKVSADYVEQERATTKPGMQPSTSQNSAPPATRQVSANTVEISSGISQAFDSVTQAMKRVGKVKQQDRQSQFVTG